jgi:hypothetical protein
MMIRVSTVITKRLMGICIPLGSLGSTYKQKSVLAPDGNHGLGYSELLAHRGDTLANLQGLVSIECAKLMLVTRPRRSDQHPQSSLALEQNTGNMIGWVNAFTYSWSVLIALSCASQHVSLK